MKLFCKIFKNPTEEQLNEFLRQETTDVFSIQVVIEQGYKLNVDEQDLPNQFVYIFYRR